MRHEPTNTTLPAAPPEELLSELDAAARALAALDARGTHVTLRMDGSEPGLRIALDEGAGPRELTPTQLFELLS